MSIHVNQEQRLRATIDWARRLHASLGTLQRTHGDRVLFRPASTGISMVGLLPARPQRGKSGITNLKDVAANFERLFDDHCLNVEQGRITGEKALQSFLIREANMNDRRMVSVNAASAMTDEPVDLCFITDELALPVEGGKIVCDLLALRRDAGRLTRSRMLMCGASVACRPIPIARSSTGSRAPLLRLQAQIPSSPR
jgi:hypothetical protein